MSDRDEMTAIARSLRRKLERERAAGTGDLLAAGALKAMKETGAESVAARVFGEAGIGSTAEATVLRGEPGPGASPLTSPAAPATLPTVSPRSTVASAVAASSERPDLEESEPSNMSLFGEPEAKPKRRVSLDEPLPSMYAPLSPIDTESRKAILAAGWPVLEEIAAQARTCTKCGLCETRTQAVPGVGTGSTGIVFVGEAPGADEDAKGEPFVGRAGQLLTKIIQAMDNAQLIPGVPLSRDTVFICNVLKCRPPENRNPLPHEIEACSPYLRRQLEMLQPKIICCLGKFAAELLVGVKGTIGGLRGKVYRYQGAKLIVTYHPAACLRNPDYKRPVWEDMQLLAREYLAS
jgi:DNA polymerase